MSDLDNDPGKHGLRAIADISYTEGAWEYDFRRVWADERGKLYTARTSGCSCGSPFDELRASEPIKPQLSRVVDQTDIERLRREAIERVPMAKWLDFRYKLQNALDNPTTYAFDPVAYAAAKAEEEWRTAVAAGLRAAAKDIAESVDIPGLDAVRWSVHKLVPVVEAAKDLTTGETFVLGLFMANAAEQGMAKVAAEQRAMAEVVDASGDD